MSTGPSKAASSRRASDHFRPIGIVGHEIEQNVGVDEDHSALAACHGHDLVCAQTPSGMAAQAGESARPGLPLDLDQDDSAVLASLEINHAPRTEAPASGS
jgi:hypothetical protein